MANLLLVEDDASVRRLVTLQLSLVGYDVRAAEDAAAAVKTVRRAAADSRSTKGDLLREKCGKSQKTVALFPSL